MLNRLSRFGSLGTNEQIHKIEYIRVRINIWKYYLEQSVNDETCNRAKRGAEEDYSMPR